MNKSKAVRVSFSTMGAGITMWVTAGIWHNLILPLVQSGTEAHHEGLLVGLIAYLVLAMLMTFIFVTSRLSGRTVVRGLILGAVVGVLWVFPHGLALAGTHGTSIGYEVRNAIYHVFEQGIGGVVIALLIGSPISAD